MPSAQLPGTLSFADKGIAFGFDPDVSPAGLLVPAYMTNNAMHVWVKSKHAGERDENATNGTDHQAVSEECASSAAIDLSNNASTTVWPGPALLTGIWVEATIGAASITIDDNATSRLAVPVAIPIGIHRIPGLIFETNLIVNPQDASTGQIRLLFRPLPTSVTWAY